VHGSISQLIDEAGTVKASYGYTVYGGSDAGDTQSLTAGDTNSQAPINPMRYSGKCTDSGTATSATAQPDYDMGARRYGPNTGRFLQADAFASSLGDLGLAVDPLTQNRYALAGGNPISYVETDGHTAMADHGGGCTSPAPPPPAAGIGEKGRRQPVIRLIVMKRGGLSATRLSSPCSE
jgi:RHS repeat-associated protein